MDQENNTNGDHNNNLPAITQCGQIHLTEKNRLKILDWLMEITNIYKLRCHTFQLGINIMDRYLLSECVLIDIYNLKAVGIICLRLASMVEEVKHLDIVDCHYICKNTYSKMKLYELELRILDKLDYRVYYHSVWQFVKLFSNRRSLNTNCHYLAYFLSNVLLMTNDYLKFKPDVLAEKIVNICFVLDEEPDCFEILIEDEVEYGYIYLLWTKSMKEYVDYISNIVFNIQSIKISTEPPVINSKIQIKLPNEIVSQDTYYDNKCRYIRYTRDIIEKITIEKELGRGTYGSVYKAIINGKPAAIKIIKESVDKTPISSLMLREINNMMMLDHHNVIKFDGFYYSPDNSALYIGLELMDCSLVRLLNKKSLSEKMKRSFIVQLLRGLTYIHSKKIMHRDLSSSNVLVSGKRLVISDFGISRYYKDHAFTNIYSRNVCSLNYRPAELLVGIYPYTEQIDIWSTACIITEILTGQSIFRGNNENEVLESIYSVLGCPDGAYFNKTMLDTVNIIPLVREGKGFYPLDKYPNESKIIYQMLNYNPARRLSAEDILELFEDCFAHHPISEYDVPEYQIDRFIGSKSH